MRNTKRIPFPVLLLISALVLTGCTSEPPKDGGKTPSAGTEKPAPEATPEPFTGDPCFAYPQQIELPKKAVPVEYQDDRGGSVKGDINFAGIATVYEIFTGCADGAIVGTRVVDMEVGFTHDSSLDAKFYFVASQKDDVALVADSGNYFPTSGKQNTDDGRSDAGGQVYQKISFNPDYVTGEVELVINATIRDRQSTYRFGFELPERLGEDTNVIEVDDSPVDVPQYEH